MSAIQNISIEESAMAKNIVGMIHNKICQQSSLAPVAMGPCTRFSRCLISSSSPRERNVSMFLDSCHGAAGSRLLDTQCDYPIPWRSKPSDRLLSSGHSLSARTGHTHDIRFKKHFGFVCDGSTNYQAFFVSDSWGIIHHACSIST